MGIKCNTERVVKYDKDLNEVVTCLEVTAQLVGNKGTVHFQEGPMYAKDWTEVSELRSLLEKRLVSKLPGLDVVT